MDKLQTTKKCQKTEGCNVKQPNTEQQLTGPTQPRGSCQSWSGNWRANPVPILLPNFHVSPIFLKQNMNPSWDRKSTSIVNTKDVGCHLHIVSWIASNMMKFPIDVQFEHCPLPNGVFYIPHPSPHPPYSRFIGEQTTPIINYSECQSVSKLTWHNKHILFMVSTAINTLLGRRHVVIWDF